MFSSDVEKMAQRQIMCAESSARFFEAWLQYLTFAIDSHNESFDPYW